MSHLQGTAFEDGTDMFSQNVSNKPPSYATQNPKRQQISLTPWWKPEITYLITILDSYKYITAAYITMHCMILPSSSYFMFRAPSIYLGCIAV